MDILELLQWFGGKSVLTLTPGPIWKRITGQQVIFYFQIRKVNDLNFSQLTNFTTFFISGPSLFQNHLL